MFLRPPPEWLPRIRQSKWNPRRLSLALDEPSVVNGNAVGADHGDDVECDQRLALLVGADFDGVPLVVDNVTDADAVAVVIVRALEGGAVVAAIRVTAAATPNVTNGWRSLSAPTSTAFPSWLTMSPTPKPSPSLSCGR